MLISQLDPLTEQQVMGIYSLQQSTQQAEEALSQGLEQLQQSLIETIAGGPVDDGMQQMVVALGKLENLEGFVRQVIKSLFNTHNQMPIIDTIWHIGNRTWGMSNSENRALTFQVKIGAFFENDM